MAIGSAGFIEATRPRFRMANGRLGGKKLNGILVPLVQPGTAKRGTWCFSHVLGEEGGGLFLWKDDEVALAYVIRLQDAESSREKVAALPNLQEGTRDRPYPPPSAHLQLAHTLRVRKLSQTPLATHAKGTMARGNQRDKAREKNQKEAAKQVCAALLADHIAIARRTRR